MHFALLKPKQLSIFSNLDLDLFNIFINNLSKNPCNISLLDEIDITLFVKIYLILFLVSIKKKKNEDI